MILNKYRAIIYKIKNQINIRFLIFNNNCNKIKMILTKIICSNLIKNKYFKIKIK